LGLQSTATPDDDEVLMTADLRKFFCHALNVTPAGHRVIAKLPVHARIERNGKLLVHTRRAEACVVRTTSGRTTG
jgi:hypothetical protein